MTKAEDREVRREQAEQAAGDALEAQEGQEQTSSAKKSGGKKWENKGQRTIQLAPRVNGQAHFEFNPGDVIESASPTEEHYFEELHEVQEHVAKPKSDAERVKELEAENLSLKQKLK